MRPGATVRNLARRRGSDPLKGRTPRAGEEPPTSVAVIGVPACTALTGYRPPPLLSKNIPGEDAKRPGAAPPFFCFFSVFRAVACCYIVRTQKPRHGRGLKRDHRAMPTALVWRPDRENCPKSTRAEAR